MKVPLQKGARLGYGSFGTVYRATELATGRLVALKQSRVSTRIKRSLLQHEAQVLKLLSGHPAIPQVYAYGRIEHFELLSIQLLGQTLGDATEEQGPLPVGAVIEIADQLLSALEHVHSKGLIHRDIKPDNVLLVTPGSWTVCLIDFGLAYPAPKEGSVADHSSEPSQIAAVFGTLAFASLNAHDGLKLTYRDDLESLAYSLLWLLRGRLPWSCYTKHGTVLGRIRQVRVQKQRLSGSCLADGVHGEFGELVEYARSLPAGAVPDYQEWRERLRRVTQVTNEERHNPIGDSAQRPTKTQADPRPPPPIQPGQITLVRLISSVTAEGYSIQAGHETTYIPDSRFNAPEWNFPAKPCIILRVEWNDRANAYRFTAVPISKNDELERGTNQRVPVVSSESPLSHSLQAMVSPRPDWPLKRSYCYIFKRPMVFYCLPSQTIISSTWTVTASGLDTLGMALTPTHTPKLFDKLRSPDPDIRYDAKMKIGYVKLYAHVSPLTHGHIGSESVDWNSTRAWFDECVKASRYYDACNGNFWTHALPKQSSEGSEELWDSYRGSDFELWEAQQERDRSLTLEPVLEGGNIELKDMHEGLDEIELVGNCPKEVS